MRNVVLAEVAKALRVLERARRVVPENQRGMHYDRIAACWAIALQCRREIAAVFRDMRRRKPRLSERESEAIMDAAFRVGYQAMRELQDELDADKTKAQRACDALR